MRPLKHINKHDPADENYLLRLHGHTTTTGWVSQIGGEGWGERMQREMRFERLVALLVSHHLTLRQCHL